METERPDLPRPEAAPRNELRALAQLRDRVEAAALEVERLRAENAALAARVAELEAGASSPALSLFAEDEGVEKLRVKIQGFIAAIDQVLNAPEPAAGGGAAARRDA